MEVLRLNCTVTPSRCVEAIISTSYKGSPFDELRLVSTRTAQRGEMSRVLNINTVVWMSGTDGQLMTLCTLARRASASNRCIRDRRVARTSYRGRLKTVYPHNAVPSSICYAMKRLVHIAFLYKLAPGHFDFTSLLSIACHPPRLPPRYGRARTALYRPC